MPIPTITIQELYDHIGIFQHFCGLHFTSPITRLAKVQLQPVQEAAFFNVLWQVGDQNAPGTLLDVHLTVHHTKRARQPSAL